MIKTNLMLKGIYIQPGTRCAEALERKNQKEALEILTECVKKQCLLEGTPVPKEFSK